VLEEEKKSEYGFKKPTSNKKFLKRFNSNQNFRRKKFSRNNDLKMARKFNFIDP